MITSWCHKTWVTILLCNSGVFFYCYNMEVRICTSTSTIMSTMCVVLDSFLISFHYFLSLLTVNLALNRPTEQSSLYGIGPSHLAVDGSHGTNYHSGECAHTAAEATPWWKVDLGYNFCVTDILLVNRADCCRELLIHPSIHPSIHQSTSVELSLLLSKLLSESSRSW